MNQDLPIRRPGDTPRKQCGRQTLYLCGDGGRIVATGVRSQRDATGRWQAAS